MEKVSYQTVIGDNKIFDTKVNSRLNSGWELYGNPYTIPVNPQGEHWFCQALIKKEVKR